MPASGMMITWNEVAGAESIRFEIENEEEGVALKADLPGDAVGFNLPEGWIQPGSEYVIDVKAA